MSSEVNRRIVLAARPVGKPTAANFRLEEVPVPVPGEGQLVCRNLYLSLDPYMRGRMNDGPSYAKPVGIGEPMEGEAVGVVTASRLDGFAVGDLVAGRGGWQDYSILGAGAVRKIVRRPTVPLSTALGVLGMPGRTAYVGLRDIGQPKVGETLVVAAASGPVGSAVGQIAKLKGCRVIGMAGSADKCLFVTEELGFDACLDHKDPDLAAKLKDACPEGIDVYWENVGGAAQAAVLPLLNDFARIPVCGLIAWYNATQAPAGPDRLPQLFRMTLTKRLRIEGFIVSDKPAGDFETEMGGWVESGQIRFKEDVRDGLENAPAAFMGMLDGENFGKLVVKIAPEP